MIFHTQEREEAWVACHPERSEGSLDGQEMLRSAQQDRTGCGRESSLSWPPPIMNFNKLPGISRPGGAAAVGPEPSCLGGRQIVATADLSAPRVPRLNFYNALSAPGGLPKQFVHLHHRHPFWGDR